MSRAPTAYNDDGTLNLTYMRELREYHEKVEIEGRCQCCWGEAEYVTVDGLPICERCSTPPEPDCA